MTLCSLHFFSVPCSLFLAALQRTFLDLFSHFLLFISSALALLSDSYLQLYSSISYESLLLPLYFIYFPFSTIFYFIPASALFLTVFHFRKRCSNSYIFLRILVVISFYKLKMSEAIILKDSKGLDLWERKGKKDIIPF